MFLQIDRWHECKFRCLLLLLQLFFVHLMRSIWIQWLRWKNSPSANFFRCSHIHTVLCCVLLFFYHLSSFSQSYWPNSGDCVWNVNTKPSDGKNFNMLIGIENTQQRNQKRSCRTFAIQRIYWIKEKSNKNNQNDLIISKGN